MIDDLLGGLSTEAERAKAKFAVFVCVDGVKNDLKLIFRYYAAHVTYSDKFRFTLNTNQANRLPAY